LIEKDFLESIAEIKSNNIIFLYYVFFEQFLRQISSCTR
jgi:hypothetical protein